MRFVFFPLTATLTSAAGCTTSLGDANPYLVSAITTDSAGNTYVVGSRQLCPLTVPVVLIGDGPIALPTPGFTPGCSDVFVSKLDPTGKLLFTDTFAGKGIDTGTAIAVDQAGNIYA